MTFEERQVNMDGCEFQKYTPTKQDREDAEAIMDKLFNRKVPYKSLSDVFIRKR